MKKIFNKAWRFKGKEMHYLKTILNQDIKPGSSKSMNEKQEKKFAKLH